MNYETTEQKENLRNLRFSSFQQYKLKLHSLFFSLQHTTAEHKIGKLKSSNGYTEDAISSVDFSGAM
jgi:hypothetical protein